MNDGTVTMRPYGGKGLRNPGGFQGAGGQVAMVVQGPARGKVDSECHRLPQMRKPERSNCNSMHLGRSDPCLSLSLSLALATRCLSKTLRIPRCSADRVAGAPAFFVPGGPGPLRRELRNSETARQRQKRL